MKEEFPIDDSTLSKMMVVNVAHTTVSLILRSIKLDGLEMTLDKLRRACTVTQVRGKHADRHFENTVSTIKDLDMILSHGGLEVATPISEEKRDKTK